MIKKFRLLNMVGLIPYKFVFINILFFIYNLYFDNYLYLLVITTTMLMINVKILLKCMVTLEPLSNIF